MSSAAYLRERLLAAPEPFEYRLWVDAEAREAVLAAAAEVERLEERKEELDSLPNQDKRARSIADKPPTAQVVEELARAKAALEEAEAAPGSVILRWMPQDGEQRNRLLAGLIEEMGRTPTVEEFTIAQTAVTFVDAFTPDGEPLKVEWSAFSQSLAAADRNRILAGVRTLNEEARGAPFMRASSGRPVTSSTSA